MYLRTDSVSAKRVGQGKVGGVTHRMMCIFWLLWLAVEMPLLGLVGPILALVVQVGLENATLTFRVLISGSKGIWVGVISLRLQTSASLLMGVMCQS